MAYARSLVAPRDLAIPEQPRARALPEQTAKKPGLFTRLLAAIEAANMRRAEREIARYLGACGGKMTDDLEREIERRFLSPRG